MAARTDAAATDLVVTRVFDAPRDLVWKAWTEPKRFEQWWGPRDYRGVVTTSDLRVGGTHLWCMQSPDGQSIYSTGVFKEIVPGERLVYTDSFADEHGHRVPASHYGLPGEWPEATITVRFEDAAAGKTRLTVTHALPPGDPGDMTALGWSESFDKLSVVVGARPLGLTVILPTEREIMMVRVFDAPRRLVFEAHTKPEHLRHWWGPREFTMASCDMDFRPGGQWRYVLRSARGDFAFRGEFREIVPPERIVWTFEFEGAPGDVAVETLTLVERNGKTTLTTRSVAPSRAARDAVLQSGMETGAAETWDRLGEYVVELARRSTGAGAGAGAGAS
jgi:uncharacterized protein YndB with AHSA1/START domain